MLSIENIKIKLEENDYNLEELTEEEYKLFCKIGELRNHKNILAMDSNERFYLVLDIVEYADANEELVIYKPLCENKRYAKSIDVFLSDFQLM